MSELPHSTAAPVANVTESTEPTATTAAAAPLDKPADSSLPTGEPAAPAVASTTATDALPETTQKADEVTSGPAQAEEPRALPATAPEVPAADAAEKAVEPLTEGQLAMKGPGFIKQIVPSKREFWLSDAAVTPQHLDLYMRGEKPEISNPVVAWASQTGKGLLFFNKKGETNRIRPQSVLPLYDATDLKKAHPHEIVFKLHGHEHTLKAANDAERDGWFMSLQRAIEVGKTEKESIRASEGYKAEIEKLNKPNTLGNGVAGGAVAAVRNKSQPKKAEEGRRTASDADEEAAGKKARSTSRGVFDKLKGKKDDAEAKKEEKKEEATEAKADKEAEKYGEAAPEAALAGVGVGAGAAAAAVGAAEESSAPGEEKVAPTAEPAIADATPKAEEKKTSKRGSIFGRVHSGFSSIKSPGKEKDQKEAELKPQVPPKDTAVAEAAPQIPEPTTEPTVTDTADKSVDAKDGPSTKPVEAAKEKVDELAQAASGQKKGFLSGFGGLSFGGNKRDRSASPSAVTKETPAKAEPIPSVLPKEEAAVPAAATEPVVDASPESAVQTSAVGDAAEKPAEKVEEHAKPSTTATNDAASPSDKRQSVFGNLGRRASKAFKGFQTPTKKDSSAVAGAKKPETPAASATAGEEPKVNGESKPAVEEPSVADATPIGQTTSTPTVTASA